MVKRQSRTARLPKRTKSQKPIHDILQKWAGISRRPRRNDSISGLWSAANPTPPSSKDLKKLASALEMHVRPTLVPKLIRGADLGNGGSLSTVESLLTHVDALTRQERLYQTLCKWAGLGAPPAELETIGETWLDNANNKGVPCPINALIQQLNAEFSELQMDLVGWFGSKGEDKVVRNLDIYIENRPTQ